jgi:predicted small lipoprotein YifL
VTGARPGARRAARLLSAILLFSLAACGGAPPLSAPDASGARDAASEEESGRAPDPAPGGSGVAALPPASLDPARLAGLTRDKVRDLLGQPTFVRRESVAEFWRYRHRTCILELYFYEKGGAQVLDHMETRAAGRDAQAIGRCLGALVAARRPG